MSIWAEGALDGILLSLAAVRSGDSPWSRARRAEGEGVGSLEEMLGVRGCSLGGGGGGAAGPVLEKMGLKKS